MISIESVKKLAESKISDGVSYYLVKISVNKGNKITILLDNDYGVSIADCISMSKHIGSNLDRELEDYELNVMSAGLTEPLLIPRQYQKNIGKKVDIITKNGEKLTGKISSVTNDGIILESELEIKKNNKNKNTVVNNIILNYSQIKETKRVISF